MSNSKTALQNYIRWCPFGPAIRTSSRCDKIRMSGPGHQCGEFDIRSSSAAHADSECQIQKPHCKTIFAGVPSVLPFVQALAATRYECQDRDTSAVNLTFAPVLPRTPIANVKFKNRTAKLYSLVSLRSWHSYKLSLRQDTNVRTGTPDAPARLRRAAAPARPRC